MERVFVSRGFCEVSPGYQSGACFAPLPESLTGLRGTRSIVLNKKADSFRVIASGSPNRIRPFSSHEGSPSTTTSSRLQHLRKSGFLTEDGRAVTRGGIVTSALPVDLPNAAVAAAVPTISFLLLRVAVYFRLQFITAAMLGRHVPRGGARVVDLNVGGGRNLYYLPKDVLQVVAINPTGNLQVLENQAINAGVPIQIQQGSPGKLVMAANSADAVVSVDFLGQLSSDDVTNMLSEIARVLKPGKPLVFIESARGEGGAIQAVQQVWWAALSAIGKGRSGNGDVVPFLRDAQMFQGLEFDRILDFQDPHVVGVAFRVKEDVPAKDSKESDKGLQKSTRRNKGFSKGVRM